MRKYKKSISKKRVADKMIKALHINSNYLTSKLHENLLDRLENEDLHNTVFMPIKKETKENFLYQSKHEVYSPVSFHSLDKYIFSFKQRKIYKQLHEQINLEEYNLVHAHTLFTDGNIAYKLNKEYGIPYVVTVRGFTDIDGFFNKRINLRKRGRQILKNASNIIFLSDTNRQELLKNFIKDDSLKNEIVNKSFVIPNGIDGLYFEYKGTPKKLLNEGLIKFIQVGQVTQRKNGLGSVYAVRKFIEKTGLEAELLFIGKIVEEDYANKIKEVGKDFVSYKPPVGIKELINIYRENDIFIMPSFSETFGLVYPEAMSQGLPVIYTKGQGFDGQYEDGEVGYPVEARNQDDILEKIEWIIEDYDKISDNAINAIDKFNWDRLSEKYKKLYSEIVIRNEEKK